MTTLTSSKKTAIFTRTVFHFKASVLDLFGRSCPGEEVGNAILLVSLVSDVRFPRVLGQALSGQVMWLLKWDREETSLLLGDDHEKQHVLTCCVYNQRQQKRRDCVRCWLHSIVSSKISRVVLNWRFTSLSFLRLQNSFGKMSIQPHAWLTHTVFLYSS